MWIESFGYVVLRIGIGICWLYDFLRLVCCLTSPSHEVFLKIEAICR